MALIRKIHVTLILLLCSVFSDAPLVLFREPVWNETFTTDLFRNAENVGFTVFHDATMPPGSNTNLVLFP